MTAADLRFDLIASGFTLSLDGDRLLVVPGSRLTADQTAAIREHKTALVELVEDGSAADPFAETDAAVLRQMAAGAWRHEATVLPPWMPRWGYTSRGS
jgi:hypothetical protein